MLRGWFGFQRSDAIVTEYWGQQAATAIVATGHSSLIVSTVISAPCLAAEGPRLGAIAATQGCNFSPFEDSTEEEAEPSFPQFVATGVPFGSLLPTSSPTRRFASGIVSTSLVVRPLLLLIVFLN